MQPYFCCMTLVDDDIPLVFFLGNLHFCCRTFIDNGVPYFFSKPSFFVAELSPRMVSPSFFSLQPYFCCITLVDDDIPLVFFFLGNLHFCCRTFIDNAVPYFFSRQSFFVAKLSSMMVFLIFFLGNLIFVFQNFQWWWYPLVFFLGNLTVFCCITFIYDGIP